MLVESGDRAYYSESELELWWVNIPLSISGEKRGVRVYYSDQVVMGCECWLACLRS
ncbi:hypothetical protein T02_1300 [Trichinella nativa]|uniref:Uncharacterized protein n=1 Tax=Trichinella nativa TaxID=6335 RepID=A0A0V1KH87_9BILA|nr:hypothetical protein T02_1300 [Trichinella nativa]